MRVFIAILLCAQFMCNVSYAGDLSASIRQRMAYLAKNQAVISKNLANADTPGYKAMELREPAGTSRGGLVLKTTSPHHMSMSGKSGKYTAVRQKDAYETAPNGNNVSIEEQMVKMSENSRQYQVSVNVLRRINGLLAIATGERQ